MIAPATNQPPTLLWKADEAAAAIQVCEKTLWSLTAPRGPIPCVRLGRSIRYSPAAIQRWIDEKQHVEVCQ
jgi:predicted DNA-binding transcriptional regulator AlpA